MAGRNLPRSNTMAEAGGRFRSLSWILHRQSEGWVGSTRVGCEAPHADAECLAVRSMRIVARTRSARATRGGVGHAHAAATSFRSRRPTESGVWNGATEDDTTSVSVNPGHADVRLTSACTPPAARNARRRRSCPSGLAALSRSHREAFIPLPGEASLGAAKFRSRRG